MEWISWDKKAEDTSWRLRSIWRYHEGMVVGTNKLCVLLGISTEYGWIKGHSSKLMFIDILIL